MSKSLLSTLVLSVFFSSAMLSQVTTGFKAGVTISDVNNLELSSATTSSAATFGDDIDEGRVGVFAGFLVDIPLSDRLSLVPEFLYSQQGKDLEGLRLDYLNLPIQFKFNINNLYVGAGPQVGVRVWKSEQSNVFSNFDASVFGNIGYTFGSNFFIEARYTYGVTDIFQDGESFTLEQGSNPTFTNLEGNNVVILFGIGYRI